jgi:hypothetical protein
MSQEIVIFSVACAVVVFGSGFISGHLIARRQEKKHQELVDNFYNMSIANPSTDVEFTSRRKVKN